jgi:glyoxylate/hydroxypyruvate reductase
MTLLIHSVPGPVARWAEAARAALPEMEVRTADDAGNADEVDYVLVARAAPGELARFAGLRFIATPLAGVDGLLGDPELPDVPLVRCAAPGGAPMITEFAVLHVLRHHRQMPEFAAAQARREWIRPAQKTASERRVGFLGLGNIAGPPAAQLAAMGFRVAAWTRRARQVPGIESFHGKDGLAPFLRRSEILVNLLALTQATTGIIAADTLALLPEGAAFINLGRGQHVVDADLIAALDSGRLAAATLDVFRTEPLPADDALWRHPRITITPHAARVIRPEDVIPQLAENIRRDRAGAPLLQAVDRSAGY